MIKFNHTKKGGRGPLKFACAAVIIINTRMPKAIEMFAEKR